MAISRRIICSAVAVTLLSAPALSAQGPLSTGFSTSGGLDLVWKAALGTGPLAQAFVITRPSGAEGGAGVGFQWIFPNATGTVAGGAADGNYTRESYVFQTTFLGGSVASITYQCAVDDATPSCALAASIERTP